MSWVFCVGAVDGLEHGTAILEIEKAVKTAKGAVVVGGGFATLIALWVEKGVNVDKTREAVVKLDGRLGTFFVNKIHVVATASVIASVETHFHCHQRSVKLGVFSIYAASLERSSSVVKVFTKSKTFIGSLF